MKLLTYIVAVLVLTAFNLQAQWAGVLGGSRAASGPVATTYVTGETLGSLRHNGGGYETGMRITIGASNVVVTQIGRWCVSGDSHTHVLNIRSDATTNVVGTVTINNSGAPSGQFNYGTLASPVTLTALGTYWVTSLETTDEDQFYDYTDTTVTTTAVAAVISAVYCLPDGSGSGNQGGVGSTYGPVSIKYTSP